jgi:hypothetical protein
MSTRATTTETENVGREWVAMMAMLSFLLGDRCLEELCRQGFPMTLFLEPNANVHTRMLKKAYQTKAFAVHRLFTLHRLSSFVISI